MKIKKILKMFKPTKIVIKDFEKWEDIGEWRDFHNIGTIIIYKDYN